MSNQQTNLKAIADAIRAKDGTTDAIPANTFAERIAALSGGGESHDVEDGIIDKTISGAYRNDRVKSVGANVFYSCTALTAIDFPSAERINHYTFYSCTALTMVDFSSLTQINGYAFLNCAALTTVVLRAESVCVLDHVGGFSSTPIASGTGYIYVPSALIEDYKAATNWSTYADQLRALEDYTVDGTTTGALDESKI